MRIVWEMLVPEALPGILAGLVMTLVALVGASAMAGAICAGGRVFSRVVMAISGLKLM